MSIGSVIVMPTPTAGPLIAAITGLTHSKMRSDTMPPPSRGTPAVGLHVAAALGERVAAGRQVGAGAEPAARTGDDHGADVVVGIGAIEGVDHLAHHRVGERVELVRPVQRDAWRRGQRPRTEICV